MQINGITVLNAPPDRTTPAPASTVGRVVQDLTVPIGAGIVAEQLQKALLRRGNIPAALAGLAGAALFTSAAEGGIQMVRNAIDGHDIMAGVANRATQGLQMGAITGGVTLLSPKIEAGIARRFTRLHPIAVVGTANAVSGAIGGAARTAVDNQTWANGFVPGLRRMGMMAGLNAGTALVSGAGIKAALHYRVLPKVSWLPYPFNA